MPVSGAKAAKLDLVVAVVAVVAAAAAIAACSSKSGASADAGLDGSGPADTAATTCDPAAQNCASDTDKCDFVCENGSAVLGCVRNADGGALGSTSSAAMPCARGSGCLSADAGVACRKYCAGDGDCLTGERCHNVTVAVACSGGSTQIPLHYCY